VTGLILLGARSPSTAAVAAPIRTGRTTTQAQPRRQAPPRRH